MKDYQANDSDRVDRLAERIADLEKKVDQLNGRLGQLAESRVPAASAGNRDLVTAAPAAGAVTATDPGNESRVLDSAGDVVRALHRDETARVRHGGGSLGLVGVLMVFGAGVTIAGIWLLVATAIDAGLLTDTAVIVAGLVLTGLLFAAGAVTARTRLPGAIAAVFVAAASLGYSGTVVAASGIYQLWPPIVTAVLVPAGTGFFIFWLARHDFPAATAWAAGLNIVVAVIDPGANYAVVRTVELVSTAPIVIVLVVIAVTRKKPWSGLRATAGIVGSVAMAAHLALVWTSDGHFGYLVTAEAVLTLVVAAVLLSGRTPSPGAISDSCVLVLLPAAVLTTAILVFDSWQLRGTVTVVTVLYLAVALAGARLSGGATSDDPTTAADGGDPHGFPDSQRLKMIITALALIPLHSLAVYQGLIETSPLSAVDYEVLRLGMLLVGAAAVLGLARVESLTLPVICWSLLMIAGPLPLIESTLDLKPLWMTGTMSIITGIACVVVSVVAVIVAARFGPLPAANAVVVFVCTLVLSYAGIVTVVAFVLSPVGTTTWAVFIGQAAVSVVWLIAAGWLLLAGGASRSKGRGALGLALAIAASIKLVVVDLAGSNDWIRIGVFLVCGITTLVIAVARARRDRSAAVPDSGGGNAGDHPATTGAPVAANGATPHPGTGGWSAPYAAGNPPDEPTGGPGQR